MIEATTVMRALKVQIQDTDVVSGRVFNMQAVPPDVTYPFVAILPLNNGNPILSGDGSDTQEWEDQAQVDVYFKSGRDIDPIVIPTIVRALNFQATIRGQAARFRSRAIANVPGPDQDVSVRYSITVAGYRPLEAL